MSTIIHTHGREDSSLGNAFVVKEDLPFVQRHYDRHVKREHPSMQLTLVSGKPIVIPIVMVHCFESRENKLTAA